MQTVNNLDSFSGAMCLHYRGLSTATQSKYYDKDWLRSYIIHGWIHNIHNQLLQNGTGKENIVDKSKQ